MLLALPLPAVPAVVELGLLALELLELGLLELGLLVLDPALPDVPLDAVDEPEAGRALVNMNWPLERVLLDAAPVVPLVPVAPVAPVALPPCRQPVTVIVRLAPGV